MALYVFGKEKSTVWMFKNYSKELPNIKIILKRKIKWNIIIKIILLRIKLIQVN